MKRRLTIVIIVYLTIGLLFSFYVWSQDMRTFICGDVVRQHTHNFTTGTGSFKNPDPGNCIRKGFEMRSIATIPYLTVGWPVAIGGKIVENRNKPFLEQPDAGTIHPFVITETDVPDGWHLRRGEGFGDSDLVVFFTKDPDIPWPQYELGELGEYVSVSMREMSGDPKQWAEDYALCGDVLVHSCTWDFTNGRYHLQVEHDTPAADAQTDYFLDYDRVAIVTLYPLDSDRETKIAYARFLHNTVAPLIDTAYSRNVLRENCAEEIPRELVDDSSADYENGVVTMYWWDGETQESKKLTVPYEPQTGFAGCSESVKAFLEHLPGPINIDTQRKSIDKYLTIDETLETIESNVCDTTSFRARRITIVAGAISWGYRVKRDD